MTCPAMSFQVVSYQLLRLLHAFILVNLYLSFISVYSLEFTDVDLGLFESGPNGFKILANGSGAESAFKVRRGLDVNGDFIEDTIAGAFSIDANSKVDAGMALVIFGTDAVVNYTDVALADFQSGVGGYRVLGASTGDHLGVSVSGLADTNGDQVGDVLIGASRADAVGRVEAGVAYVLFGRNDVVSYSDVDMATFTSGVLGYRILGANAGDNLGISVSAVGDVNNDALADMVVGANLASPEAARIEAGIVYCIYGQAATSGTDLDLASFIPGQDGYRVLGAVGGDELGVSLAGAGDLNGDLLGDFVILQSPSGISTVLFGNSDGDALVDVDLSTFTPSSTQGVRIIGTDIVVSAAGDVNGDQIGDLIIGRPTATAAGRSNAGIVYIFFGTSSVSGASSVDIDLDTFTSGSIGFRLLGAAADDGTGISVDLAGDINGDGLADVIAGAYRADGFGRSGSGITYVFFGVKGRTEFADVDLATFTSGIQGFRLIGGAASDNSGRYVGAAGDINGDGNDDVVVGAYGDNPFGRGFDGITYVLFGFDPDARSAEYCDAFVSSNSFGATLNYTVCPVYACPGESLVMTMCAGEATCYSDTVLRLYSPTNLTAELASDDNGCSETTYGCSELVHTFEDATTCQIYELRQGCAGGADVSCGGRVVIYPVGYDPPSFAPTISPTPPAPTAEFTEFEDLDLAAFQSGSRGVIFHGDIDGAESAFALSPVGDVNLDGVDDAVIGSSGANPTGDRVDAGVAFVALGVTDFKEYTDVYLSQLSSGATGFLILGARSVDNLGKDVTGAGDVNNDGIPDILVSAPGADPLDRLNAGSAYVIYGINSTATVGTGAGETTLDLLTFTTGDLGFIMLGAAASDNFGTSVSGLGDVNGDKIDDFCVGASRADFGVRTHAGIVYVIYGLDGNRQADFDLLDLTAGSFDGFRIFGSATDDEIGNHLSFAGDVDGDDLNDVIIGRASSGFSYIVLGRRTNPNEQPNIDLFSFQTGTDGIRIVGSDLVVKTSGDINGDALSDIIIGSPLDSAPNRSASGVAYVLYGMPTDNIPDFDVHLDAFATGTAGFRILGGSAGDGLGVYVDGVGDFNGDYITDIVISAYLADEYNRTDSGTTYVLFGGEGNVVFSDLDLNNFVSGNHGFRIIGANAGDYSGRVAQAIGDFNGDGFFDIMIGAYGVDPFSRNAQGTSYVIFGRRPATYAPTLVPTVSPTSSAPTIEPSQSRAPTIAPTLEQGKTSKPTARPTREPTYRPTDKPTAEPTYRPTATPTRRPTTLSPTKAPQTSSKPTTPLLTDITVTIYDSPTYKITSGFGFAAQYGGGKVVAWGRLSTTDAGETTSIVRKPTARVVLETTDSASIVPSRTDYVIVKTDGTLTHWGAGVATEGIDAYTTTDSPSAVTKIVANEGAYAGLTSMGGVVAFGALDHGNDVIHDHACNGYAQQLSMNVTNITASAAAFAAVKEDFSVYSWGSRVIGGGVSTETHPHIQNVSRIVATRTAFAALQRSRTVVSWGDPYGGGDSHATGLSAFGSEVVHLISSASVFVAFKADTGIVTWGNPIYGGDTSEVAEEIASRVAFVTHTSTAFAALREDGSVVTWGDKRRGGDSSSVQIHLKQVFMIYRNSFAFAAINATGGVVVWGDAANGGSIPAHLAVSLASGVESITSTQRAFAAIKSGTREVVVWGNAYHGGDASSSSSGGGGSPEVSSALAAGGVKEVCSNEAAFTALLSDNTAVVWGHTVSIPFHGVLVDESSPENSFLFSAFRGCK